VGMSRHVMYEIHYWWPQCHSEHNAGMEVMHQNKQASKADFRLKM